MLKMFSKGARRADEFGSLFEPAAEHPYILDQLKQVSIYTDCLGKAHPGLSGKTRFGGTGCREYRSPLLLHGAGLAQA